MSLYYQTKFGQAFLGECSSLLSSDFLLPYKGKVDLVFTSPPFPLNRKKRYGNLIGEEYLTWFKSISQILSSYLSPTGSIVIEMGNSWEPGSPTMSTLALKSLLAFLEESELYLCQSFVWHNLAKLPSPAQWVTIDRIRVKDAYTNIWWMSKSEFPKADNRKVLVEYSDRMKKLLKSRSYNSGKRPSEHTISKESFLKDNQGAIASNVLVSSNTKSNTPYQKYCKKNAIVPHPARMPEDIAEFFIKYLTGPNDIILDPFAGSNTTGQIAEENGRRWVSLEVSEDYLKGSIGRFDDNVVQLEDVEVIK